MRKVLYLYIYISLRQLPPRLVRVLLVCDIHLHLHLSIPYRVLYTFLYWPHVAHSSSAFKYSEPHALPEFANTLPLACKWPCQTRRVNFVLYLFLPQIPQITCFQAAHRPEGQTSIRSSAAQTSPAPVTQIKHCSHCSISVLINTLHRPKPRHALQALSSNLSSCACRNGKHSFRAANLQVVLKGLNNNPTCDPSLLSSVSRMPWIVVEPRNKQCLLRLETSRNTMCTGPRPKPQGATNREKRWRHMETNCRNKWKHTWKRWRHGDPEFGWVRKHCLVHRCKKSCSTALFDTTPCQSKTRFLTACDSLAGRNNLVTKVSVGATMLDLTWRFDLVPSLATQSIFDLELKLAFKTLHPLLAKTALRYGRKWDDPL